MIKRERAEYCEIMVTNTGKAFEVKNWSMGGNERTKVKRKRKNGEEGQEAALIEEHKAADGAKPDPGATETTSRYMYAIS